MADQIKAIIFDMGGVILRTEDKSQRSALAARFGLTASELEKLVFNSPSALEATVGRISDAQHWATIWQQLNVPSAEQKACEAMFWGGDSIDQKLIAFLRSQRGSYTTALLSNAWPNARDALTNLYHCMDAFDVSVFSYEVGLAKPDPAIYRLILDRVGVEATEALFLDDVKENIQAANTLGIHGIQFLGTDDALVKIGALLQP